MSGDSCVTLVSEKSGRARMIGTSRYMQALAILANAVGLEAVASHDIQPADRVDRLELKGTNEQLQRFYGTLIKAAEAATAGIPKVT